MLRGLRSLAFSILVFVGPLSMAHAAMTFTPARPGLGGGAYDIRCGAASYLSGVTAHSGWWMDAITVHCGLIDRNNLPSRFFAREVAPYNANAQTGGSGGGKHENITCGPNYAVVGIEIDAAEQTDESGYVAYVGQFRLVCQRMDAPNDTVRSVWSVSTRPQDGSGGVRPHFTDAYCPPGQWAVGVFGRSGIYIDSMGLVCDVAFSAPLPPPPVVAVPAEKATKKNNGAVLQALGRFPTPTIDGNGVDICLHWGTSCGAPAADEFCRRNGFAASTANTIRNDAPPTLVLGDNAVCTDPTCDRFADITCK